jgi:hypothetical protein
MDPAMSQGLDKPQAALSATEKALLAAVNESSQWKPTDPRVAKAYQDLAGYYASQSRYAEAKSPMRSGWNWKKTRWAAPTPPSPTWAA